MFNLLHNRNYVQETCRTKYNRPFYRYGVHSEFYSFERHYGMPRGQIHNNLPPGRPIMSFKTIEFKAVKRSISHDKQGVKGNKETKEHY